MATTSQAVGHFCRTVGGINWEPNVSHVATTAKTAKTARAKRLCITAAKVCCHLFSMGAIVPDHSAKMLRF